MHTARVAQRREVGGAGIVTVLLEGVDEPLPHFTAGSHIEVHLPSGWVRQYSLCNAPGQTYQIAVKPEPNGRGGSLEVHQELQTDTCVTISSPRNNFELIPADRYVLVAGGIGITPLLSTAHHLWSRRRSWAWAPGRRATRARRPACCVRSADCQRIYQDR